jgi:hypothetical protein
MNSLPDGAAATASLDGLGRPVGKPGLAAASMETRVESALGHLTSPRFNGPGYTAVPRIRTWTDTVAASVSEWQPVNPYRISRQKPV